MSQITVAPRRPGGHGGSGGRPRDPQTDRAILRATVELLAEVGYLDVSVAEVARRAHVSKPAIYRRWAKKSQLVVEALVTQMLPDSETASGSAADELLALTEQLISTLTRTPLGRVLPGLVAEMAADAELAQSYRDLVIGPNRMRWRAAVERGIERGELVSDTDVELVLNALAGPLYFSLLITGEPIDGNYARGAVDLIFARYGNAGTVAQPC
jgi:AcrR family transcriptional regulator